MPWAEVAKDPPVQAKSTLLLLMLNCTNRVRNGSLQVPGLGFQIQTPHWKPKP